MKKRLIAGVLGLCFALGLCGCQLALQEEGGRDRLIGAFITTEHVDTITLDIASNGKLSSGHEPIYAEYYEETLVNEDGESLHTANYHFTEPEGISCFLPMITEENGETYNTFQIDEVVQEGKRELKTIDGDKQMNTVGGTVYVPEGTYIKFYLNPVYQSADGKVYLTGGQGIHADSGDAALVLSESTKAEISGNTVEYGCKVEVWFKSRAVTERIRLVELSADNEVLRVSEFLTDELPESYESLEGTVCIVQESFNIDSDGEEQAERLVLSPEDQKYVEILIPGEKGYLVPQRCELIWA